MKSSVCSSNRLNVFINKNFIIRVYIDQSKKSVLSSANGVYKLIDNDRITDRLFSDLICNKRQQYTFKLRKRLKIVFCSK